MKVYQLDEVVYIDNHEAKRKTIGIYNTFEGARKACAEYMHHHKIQGEHVDNGLIIGYLDDCLNLNFEIEEMNVN